MALLHPDEALARILAGAVATEAEKVPLGEAAGRVLSEPLTARLTQPPFPASAMDGYAVRSPDAVLGATLRVVGTASAGHAFPGAVEAGQAVRIFTGAPVPPGADAILIQEEAERSGDAVTVRGAVRPGQSVRAEGLDFRLGQAVLPAGLRLEARHVALAAAMNVAEVSVRRRPRVAVLSTGDELVPVGGRPGPDQIIASNALAICALVAAGGGEALDLGIARDTRPALADAIDRAEAARPDILVTSGGASVGDHDLVVEALTGRGMTLDLWKIALRPGKPLAFGRLGAMRVLGLAGNPVSSYVCSLVFLKPLIAALLGLPPAEATEPALLGTDLGPNDGRVDYMRATLAVRPDGPPVATPFARQDSSMLSTLAGADCLLVRPANAPAAAAGSPCRILRLA